MTSAEKETSPEKLTCESCGKPFECGAKSGNCWCFSIAIDPQNLAQLKQQYRNCLCQECLPNSSLPENNLEKSKES